MGFFFRSKSAWKCCIALTVLIVAYKVSSIVYFRNIQIFYPYDEELSKPTNSSDMEFENIAINEDNHSEEIFFLPVKPYDGRVVRQNFPDVVIVGKVKQPYSNQQSRKVAILSRDLKKSFNSSKNETKVIFLATAFYGLWSPDHYYALQIGRESFERYDCLYKNCVVTKETKYASTANAVVFHLRDIAIDGFQFSRDPSQKWILYTMEPPWLEMNNLEMLNGVFNWTMSYREDSDIVVRYGFIGRRSADVIESDRSKISFAKRKKAAVWFVSDCCTQSGRENYVRELKRYMKVDVYGGCGKDICRPAETSACYETVMSDYLFYISFENAICKDYVTEKFFNILTYDVLPVVFGGARYQDIAPVDSYIDTQDFPSPRDLASYLNLLASNETMYQTYFKWKDNYIAYMSAWTCELCKYLHLNSSKQTIRNDLKKWFVDDAQCQRWTENGFVTKQSPVFPCYKRTLF